MPKDVYWVERLVGARVMDVVMGDIGSVTDVVETGGVDLLLVKDGGGVETLVPLVKDFVTRSTRRRARSGWRFPEARGLNAGAGWNA